MAGAGIRSLGGAKPLGNKALSAAVTERAWKSESTARSAMMAGLRTSVAKHLGGAGEGAPPTAAKLSARPAPAVSALASPSSKAAPRTRERNVELLHKLEDRFHSVAASSPRSPEHRQALSRLEAVRKAAGPEHVEAAAAGRHARTMGAVEKYRAGAEAKSIAYHEANYPGLAAKMGGHERLTIKEGDRYVRLSKGVPGDKYGGSAHSFVDKTNGDILKPASYKTPAKGARGNVFDKDSTNAASAYGAKYMRDLKPAAAPKAAPKNPLSADAKAQRAGSKADKIHGEASKAIGAEHVQNLLGSGFAFRRGSTVPQIARGGAAARPGSTGSIGQPSTRSAAQASG